MSTGTMTGLKLAKVVSLTMVGLAMAACNHTGEDAFANYPNDYRQRHPIMVTPRAAYVASECGLWPHDLGQGDTKNGWSNSSYYNHGCATQSNLTAIVANPNDLLGPRAEGPPDAARRASVMQTYRKGEKGSHTPHDVLVPLANTKQQVK